MRRPRAAGDTGPVAEQHPDCGDGGERCFGHVIMGIFLGSGPLEYESLADLQGQT